MSSRGVMSANLGLPPPLNHVILLLLIAPLLATLFADVGMAIGR